MSKQFYCRVIGSIALAGILALATSASGETPSPDPADRMTRYGLAVRDVEDVDRAVPDAFKNLSEIWTRIFAEHRLNYRSPTLKRYVRDRVAHCESHFLSVGNAFYCQSDDIIWYDPIFLARVKKVVENRSKQRADSVPSLIIAHEWGHAISARFGFGKQTTGTNVENDADCYAGAATRELINARRLPATAIREAEQMFEAKAEPDSWATGTFTDILSRSHGVKSERKLVFNFGAELGTKSCQNEKRYYDSLRKVQKPIVKQTL